MYCTLHTEPNGGGTSETRRAPACTSTVGLITGSALKCTCEQRHHEHLGTRMVHGAFWPVSKRDVVESACTAVHAETATHEYFRPCPCGNSNTRILSSSVVKSSSVYHSELFLIVST
ncbi:unnamed protein product [Pylaiella littoralis]